MRHKKYILSASLSIFLLLACVTTAKAQDKKAPDFDPSAVTLPSSSDIFNGLDIDGDKFISKKEAKKDIRGKLYERFESLDTNKDEYISLKEFEANSSKLPKNLNTQGASQRIFIIADSNKDSKLSKKELKAKRLDKFVNDFEDIDSNNDSYITIDEFEKYNPKHESNTLDSKLRK